MTGGLTHEDLTWEAGALEEAYWRAVGWALQYHIKVYRPGGAMKSLGELEDEIDDAASRAGDAAPARRSEQIAAHMRMRHVVRSRE